MLTSLSLLGESTKNIKLEFIKNAFYLFLIFLIIFGNSGIVSAVNEETPSLASPFGPMKLHKFQNCPFSIQYPADYSIINFSNFSQYQSFPSCKKYEHFMAAAPGTSTQDITTIFPRFFGLLSHDCGDEITSILPPDNTPGFSRPANDMVVLFYCEASCSKDTPIQATYEYMMEDGPEYYGEYHREQILTKQGIPVWVIERKTSSLFQDKILFFFDINDSRYFEAHFNVFGASWDDSEEANLARDIAARTTYDSLVPLVDYMFSTFHVGCIDSLTIEPEAAILDKNPDWAGGGIRIYPDRSTPTDTSTRNRIKIVATSQPKTDIYFRSFDMDDPTTNDPNLDLTDATGPLGDDNRGDPKEGSLSAQKVTSDSNGTAEVWFEVTRHPGDNFRVAASCDQEYLNSLRVEGTELKDRNGKTLNDTCSTEEGQATPLITVWRRLHLEVDSMGPVKGNQVKGSIDRVYPDNNLGTTQITFTGTEPKNLDIDQYEDGALYIEGREDYCEVISNNQTAISVRGIVPTTIKGASFILVDDDNFKGDNTLTGDEGVDVEARPETFSLLQQSDDPSKNVYAPAFIMPIMDGGGDLNNNNGNAPFILNCGPDETTFHRIISQSIGSSSNEKDDFWIAYIQIAYQPEKSDDADPNDEENTTCGYAYCESSDEAIVGSVESGSQGCLIFIETMRDAVEHYPEERALLVKTAPHELGHQMGLSGDESENVHGLMSYGPDTILAPRHLNLLRWRLKSPGME